MSLKMEQKKDTSKKLLAGGSTADIAEKAPDEARVTFCAMGSSHDSQKFKMAQI